MYELNLKSWVVLIVTALFLLCGGVGSCMYVAPKYNVWKQEMDGKAEFAKAEQNRKIGGWPEGFDPFYGAPAVLIVLADKTAFTGVYDGSLVMGNLMLAAHSLGVDSIWIHRAKEEFESEEGKALLKSLGLEGDWEGVGHCALGYAAEPLPAGAPRKPGRIVWA